MKWNRRRALLAGLGAGLAAGSAGDYARYRRRLAEETIGDELSRYANAVEAAYASEAAWQEELRELLTPSEPDLPPPPVPYDRATSGRMIRACKLAVTQYRTGRTVPSFDGDLGELEDFRRIFPGYDKVASFVAEEDQIERYFQVAEPPVTGPVRSPLEGVLRPVRRALYDTIPKIVRREYRTPVFFGFVLTSERDHLMVFRGTQTQAEWVSNLRSAQRRYDHPDSGRPLGWVHRGFLNIAINNLRPSPAEVAAGLDPSKPCYVTGHSLGAALATITAMDVACRVPRLAERLRLYTFAGPRVGDAEFAANFRRLVPNAYRIANVADTVPMVPSTKMGKGFIHVGEPWTFLAHFGDLLPNHVADTYLAAGARRVETNGRHRGLRPLDGPPVSDGGDGTAVG